MRPRPRSILAPLLATVALLLTASAPALGASAGTTFLTGGLDLPPGAIAGGESGTAFGDPDRAAVSDDGRYVAFPSDADTLDPAAQPDTTNVFRKDRLTGTVVLVSRATGAAGAVVDQTAYDVAISDDGSRVAFRTRSALDPADSDGGAADVYVRDVTGGTTTLASVGDGGQQTTDGVSDYDFSGDGRYVAFGVETALEAGLDLNGVSDVYRRDLTLARTTLVTLNTARARAADAGSFDPAISDDGAWVAFSSSATDLIAGFVAGGDAQVFVRDIGGGTNHLVSNRATLARTAGNGFATEPDIAGAPGALSSVVIAYQDDATDVAAGGVDGSSQLSVYVHPMSATSSTLVSRADGAAGANADSRAHTPSISDDGRRVAFASDADNLTIDPDYYGVYLRDLDTDRTLLGSTNTTYAVNPALSGDGSFFAWVNLGVVTSDSDPDLYGVFGRTYAPPSTLGVAELVARPPGTGPFLAAAFEVDPAGDGARTISADGRYVVFAAFNARLPFASPEGPERIYRRDTLTGAIELVSRATGANGAPADVQSDTPSISADGTRVAFRSFARLDPAHTDASGQAYVRDLAAGTTTLASRAEGLGGALPDASVLDPRISADGRHVTFLSLATNLGAPSGTHVYLRDLAGGHTQLVDRASGAAGMIANDDAEDAVPSADGHVVAFTSAANNLDPDDPAGTAVDVYVRDTVAATTALVSRRSGLGGAHSSGFSREASISADGRVVAFRSDDEQLATEAGTWGGKIEVVARTLASGANVLVSRAPGGAPANADATSASVNGDGSVVAFQSEATNLLPGIGGVTRSGVFARSLASGALSGPPAFGLDQSDDGAGAGDPSISDDGQCLAFKALGHNPATGTAGDFRTTYVYVVSGVCPKPLPVVRPIARRLARAPRPVLSRASLSHRRFRVGRRPTAQVAGGGASRTAVAMAARRAKRHRASRAPVGTTFRFTLNTRANVAIAFERPAQGRLVGRFCRRPARRLRHHLRCVRFVRAGRITRGGVAAGRGTIAFSGRIGRKALKPGAYRVRLRASNGGGVSPWVRLAFRVVR
jgi:Tol biopolymer transport system component